MNQPSLTPTLSIFPRDDALKAHIDTAMERLGSCGPDDLERELSQAYPKVVVRVRSDAAQLGNDAAWYVFRDGVVTSPDSSEWWLGSTLPSFEIGEDGSYLDANAAAAALVGRPIAMIKGARIGTFTRHEADEAAGMRTFAKASQAGGLESTAVVVRPDGQELAVDYRLIRCPEGGYTMVMRER
jgi:PAS domain-containing protein